MKMAIKKEWVAALRSKKYKQIKAQLRDNKNDRCCLGVLCDIARKHGIGRWQRHLIHYEFVGAKPGSLSYHDSILPLPVILWAGLGASSTSNTANGTKVKIRGKRTTLSWHNDSGATFSEIADAIEAQL